MIAYRSFQCVNDLRISLCFNYIYKSRISLSYLEFAIDWREKRWYSGSSTCARVLWRWHSLTADQAEHRFVISCTQRLSTTWAITCYLVRRVAIVTPPRRDMSIHNKPMVSSAALDKMLIVKNSLRYAHSANSGYELRFMFDYFPRRMPTVPADKVPKPQDTFSHPFNPRVTRGLPFEVNMNGRKAIHPSYQRQAALNLVINPTKQRKCPFPYRNDIIYQRQS